MAHIDYEEYVDPSIPEDDSEVYEGCTCNDCAHNWNDEECELTGCEIYEDSPACDDFDYILKRRK